jgi:hypothetical protein
MELAERLNDPSKVFWTDGELKVHIWNALRFWNVLAAENRVRFQATIGSPDVWYDLLSLTSPRTANLRDTDVYSWLQYALLEAQAADAAVGSGQYSSDDLVQAVQRKRDEFLFRSGCTTTVETLAVLPNVSAVALPNTVIQTWRAYWLPVSGNAWPLMKADDWVTTSYVNDLSPGNPDTFSAGVEVPYRLLITPPPDVEGNVECLTVESQASLSPTSPTLLYIPPDFVPAILWGALADLMDSAMEKTDKSRADYARMRFEQYVELMTAYPFVFSAKVNGELIYADAVEVLDCYEPNWRTVSANPSVMGLSGQNLLAFPSASTANIELFMLGSAALPVADSDPVTLGDEVIDAVLGMAQHEASFKMGFAEFNSTAPLFKWIVKLAAKKRSKLAAMSTFQETLFGRVDREEQVDPKESVSNG